MKAYDAQKKAPKNLSNSENTHPRTTSDPCQSSPIGGPERREIADRGDEDLMRGSKILPLLLLGGAAIVVALLALFARTPEERERQNAAPLVRVVVAEPTPYRFSVTAFGSVSPRTESDLIPQVSGEVLWISPSLAAGGFFESGDILARIDSADYRVDRETARAAVARAESEFGRARKERKRQLRLKAGSVASESRIDDAENAFSVAEARLLEARARLERATRDLARTELKAPYRGRVRSKKVDVGQFVTRGNLIATLYAVDFAEIRLPVPDRELAFLDIPLVPRLLTRGAGALDEEVDSQGGSAVTLTAEFAGRLHEWNGTLVRTEAELDPRTRMVHLVARVEDPYGLKEILLEDIGASPDTAAEAVLEASPKMRDRERSVPLAVGLFVEAEIEGHAIERAFVLPRDALREDDQVFIVDAEERLQFRTVEVLRTERDNVIIGAGLEAGERICTTPLQASINGMRVRVYEPRETAGRDEDEGLATRPGESAETIQ